VRESHPGAESPRGLRRPGQGCGAEGRPDLSPPWHGSRRGGDAGGCASKGSGTTVEGAPNRETKTEDGAAAAGFILIFFRYFDYDILTREDIQPLVDTGLKKIAGWRGKLLSLAARAMLIKSCVASIPVYIFSPLSSFQNGPLS